MMFMVNWMVFEQHMLMVFNVFTRKDENTMMNLQGLVFFQKKLHVVFFLICCYIHTGPLCGIVGDTKTSSLRWFLSPKTARYAPVREPSKETESNKGTWRIIPVSFSGDRITRLFISAIFMAM